MTIQITMSQLRSLYMIAKQPYTSEFMSHTISEKVLIGKRLLKKTKRGYKLTKLGNNLINFYYDGVHLVPA